MDFIISSEYDGKSVLSYLRSAAKISAGAISQLKRTDMGICVNGSHVTVRYILQKDDILSIKIDDSDESVSENIVPVKLPVDIVYEDEHIMAVSKPPYMPTHPSHKHFDDTLGNAVAYIYKERGVPFTFRPLGRLDANTSGLVILSKSRAVASFYFGKAQANEISKHYIAILEGEMNKPTFFEDGGLHVIDTPIKREDGSIIARRTCSIDEDGAQSAKTVWRLLYSGGGISIVDASPITGRTHQLRVHFASIGHPILGDSLYGNGGDRHMLHAVSLNVSKPFSDERMLLFAEPPKDISDLVKARTGKDIKSLLEGLDLSINLSKAN